jgi:hypothetical protein
MAKNFRFEFSVSDVVLHINQPQYLALFDAVISGDIKAIEDLTINKPIGQQVDFKMMILLLIE